MTSEIVKGIINYMLKERGVKLQHISRASNVTYTGLSRWTRNELDLNSENINKLQNFIKEYHFVDSIDELLALFNLQ